MVKRHKTEQRLDCERSTVVVPRSHIDGTYQALMKRNSVRKCNPNAKKAGEAHFVKYGRDPVIEARARCLLLRPSADKPLPYHSVMVLWNSRLLHQGHTILGTDQPRAPESADNAPFNPISLRPELFDLRDRAWLRHLEREGYVAIQNLLGKADVQKALGHLLDDIRGFSPSAKKVRNLGQVSKSDFPPSMNGTLMGLGMPHGSLAWFIRGHSRVHQPFKMLFPRQTLAGSTDMLFISPPGAASGVQRATNCTHAQWLHADQNEHQVCGDLRMYQGMLSLFSEETLSWSRISIPVCMAPKGHREVAGVCGEKSLLAMCISGVASTHWPQLGFPHRQGRITLGMVVHGVAKSFKQLQVRLNPNVPESKARELRKSSRAQLLRQYTVEDLRNFVHPQALKFVSEGLRPDASTVSR